MRPAPDGKPYSISFGMRGTYAAADVAAARFGLPVSSSADGGSA